MSSQQSSVSLQDLFSGTLTVFQNVCSIVTMPVEMLLRPTYGTRYFNPITITLTVVLMLTLPLVGMVGSLLPSDGGFGLFGLGTISSLFFLGSAIHAPRLWRRVFRMELEEHSQYEGDALHFFALLPMGRSFWTVRVVWEPVVVATTAIVLRQLHILDRPAMLYLLASALLLAAKANMNWYQNWLQLRIMMDTKFASPLIAKAVAGRASEKDLEKVHLAGFGDGLPADVRAAAIVQLAPPMPTLPPHVASLLSPLSH